MSKHTPGPWVVGEDGYLRGGNGDVFGRLYLGEHYDANARLITGAGTVATETGLTPRQLADQRTELLEALRELTDAAEEAAAGGGVNFYEYARIGRATIAKAEGR